MSIERDICKAIDIISSKAISTQKSPSIVLATTVECLNPFNGKYRVKYENSEFIAYNNNINTFYDINTSVYVFLKNGQLDEELIILGPAHAKKTNNYFYGIKNKKLNDYSLQDLFQGKLTLEKNNNIIKVKEISYMTYPVSKSEMSNFKFYWLGIKNDGTQVELNEFYNKKRVPGDSEINISKYKDTYTSFKCEVEMDNFILTQTIRL